MKVNVILNKKSIYDTLTPINYASSFFGIRSFTKNRYGYYSYSWSSLICTLAYVINFYVILHYWKDREPRGIVNSGSDIINVMKKLHYVVSIVAMTLAYLLAHLNYRNEIVVLKTIEDVDANLRSSNLGEKLEDKNKFLKKLQVSFLFFVYVINVGVLAIVMDLLLNDGNVGPPLYLVPLAFPRLINSTVKLQFHFYNVTLKTRAEIVNAYLNEIIASLTPTSKFTAFYKMEKDIEFMMKIHKRITDTSRLVNRIYGFQELLSFAMCFILLLSDGYIVLYSLTVGNIGDFGFVMFTSLKLVIINLIELLVDLRACMLLCAKVNHTKNILFKIKIEPENEETRNVIMVAVFKLMHDKLELTACDLFNMDFSFVFSMFASITTYLLILLQFDIDAAKTRLAAMRANLTNAV